MVVIQAPIYSSLLLMNLATPWGSFTQPTLKLWCTHSTTHSQSWPGSAFHKMMWMAFSLSMVSDAGKIKHCSSTTTVLKKVFQCYLKYFWFSLKHFENVWKAYKLTDASHFLNVCIPKSLSFRISPCLYWGTPGVHKIRPFRIWDASQVWPCFVLRCHQHSEGRISVL